MIKVPFGKPRWGFGRGGIWGSPRAVTPEEVRAQAREILSRAEKGPAWIGRCGRRHIPLILNGVTVGEIWEDVDPRTLEVGSYKYGKWGIKVQLVKDARVVGILRLPLR